MSLKPILLITFMIALAIAPLFAQDMKMINNFRIAGQQVFFTLPKP